MPKGTLPELVAGGSRPRSNVHEGITERRMETRISNATGKRRLAMQLLGLLLLVPGGLLMFVPGLGVPFLFLGGLLLLAASPPLRLRPTLVAASAGASECGARRRTG